MPVIGKLGAWADYHLKRASFDVRARVCCLVKDQSVLGTAVRKKTRVGYPSQMIPTIPSQMIPWCLGSMKLPKKSIFSTLGGRDCILNHFWGDAGNGGRAWPRGPKAFKDDLWDFNHLQTPSGTCPKVSARSSVSFHGSRMLLTHFSSDAGNDAGNRKNWFLGR